MERINGRKFGVTAKDLKLIGGVLEKVLEAIKNHEYGTFDTSDLEMEDKIALRVAEGMEDWQRQHNKGIRISGYSDMTIEIYELQELQKKIDEMRKDFVL